MNNTKRYSLKTILLAVLWITIGAGTAVLLVAAIRKKDAKQCAAVKINIEGVSNNFFVDENDVKNIIKEVANGEPVGKSIGSFNLKAMETSLEKSTWVKAAELFFDNNNILRVNILEREPIARVFTTTGTTFYIDSSIMMLPLSEKFPARLPVFTNFPSDKIVLTAADSNLLRDIRTLSMAIEKDSFRMALIDQIDITPNRTFEMMPKIGSQVIVFGDATDAEAKFSKLEIFYKEVMAKTNWNKYSTINVQYKNQVVAKLRGAEEKTADSLRTLQIMQLIATHAEEQSADSVQLLLPDNDRAGTVDSTMIQQSIQRDDEVEGAYIPAKPQEESVNKPAAVIVPKPGAEKPVIAKPIINNNKPAVVKPTVAKPVKTIINKPVEKPKPKPATKPAAQQPKATMPKRGNDYR
jgi:cell division protein FtsQ